MAVGAVGCWTVSRHKAATRPARPQHGAGRVDGRAAGVRARGRGWTRRAQQGRAAGLAAAPVGCALGAFSPFLTRFDSVLFLSQFLDIVREPGS